MKYDQLDEWRSMDKMDEVMDKMDGPLLDSF